MWLHRPSPAPAPPQLPCSPARGCQTPPRARSSTSSRVAGPHTACRPPPCPPDPPASRSRRSRPRCRFASVSHPAPSAPPPPSPPPLAGGSNSGRQQLPSPAPPPPCSPARSCARIARSTGCPS
eukprot:749536-Hanusia_phi.AAC.5